MAVTLKKNANLISQKNALDMVFLSFFVVVDCLNCVFASTTLLESSIDLVNFAP